jgi:hypothetical protein
LDLTRPETAGAGLIGTFDRGLWALPLGRTM